MTKKDFYRIIIKLFGLYTAIGLLFYLLPSNILALYYGDFNQQLLFSLIVTIIIIVILYVLIFRTDSLIRFFRLDKGYDDEKLDLTQLNAEGVLKLGLIIISGFLIIDNIPDFVINIFYLLKGNNSTRNPLSELMTMDPNGINYFVLVKSLVNLLFGFLMLTNLRSLARKLQKISNKNDTNSF